MGTITTTPNPAGGYVKVVVDLSDTPAATGVILKRYPADADLTTATPAIVRGSAPLLSYNGSTPTKPYVELSKGWAVFYDYECPFGASVTYVAEPNFAVGPNLIINPSFEADTSGWVAYNANGTIASSTAWASVGTRSLAATCGTAGTVGTILTDFVPVTGGAAHLLSVVARTAVVGRTIRLAVNWYDSVGSLIATSYAPDVASVANVNRTVQAQVSAPVGATKAKVYVIALAAQVNDVFYYDSFQFGQVVPAALVSTVGPNLFVNPSFETDITGWKALNGNASFSITNIWANTGSTGGLLTCNIAGQIGFMAAQPLSGVVPNATYGLTVLMYTAYPHPMWWQVDWHDAKGNYIGTSVGAPMTPPANIPTPMPSTVTALPGAVSGRPYFQVGGVVNNTFYLDDAKFYLNQPAVTQPASVALTLAGVPDIGWLKDPARPGSNIKLNCASTSLTGSACDAGTGVYFVGLTGRAFRADAKSFDVPGSPRGVTAYITRKDFTSALRVMTRSLADRDAIEALLAPGGPLLLQLPPAYGERDQYVQVGDYTEDRVFGDHRVAPRLFHLPYIVQDSPQGQAQGPVGARWADLPYATWADLKAAGKTWDQLGAV